MNDKIKKIFILSIIVLIIIFTLQNIIIKKFDNNIINYSTFISELNKNKIKKVIFNQNEIFVIRKNFSSYKTYIPIHDQRLLYTLFKKHVIIFSVPKRKKNLVVSFFVLYLLIICLLVFLFFIIQKIKNSGNKILFFGKNKAKIFKKNKIKIKFSDIAGCKEAKKDIIEILEYIKKPKKFQKLGSKIPKNVLLIGLPGTGKTLLAKAIAGEANIPFLSISGSEFVEIFVGIGAARIRNMFLEAKKIAPCIIFIDEIDSVGKIRGTGLNSNDEREQTLNQMLVEMDGFENIENIIIIAATNRPDVLDPALLRPGRFSRHINIDLPNIQEREEIFKIHLKKIPISSDVKISLLAREVPGFSGADIANLVNEATIFAARSNKNNVFMIDFEQAKDKIILGNQKTSKIMTKKQKELIAYHESGHIIVGKLVPDHDPIYKATIIPRGKSLGMTFFLPIEEITMFSQKQLESKISTLYGGRVAEEIIYGKSEISTGSYNDIKMATFIARNMITKWGFSKKLGPLLFLEKKNTYLLEKNYTTIKHISNETLYLIDQEIQILIQKNYKRAKKILQDNIDILYKMKQALIKYETINIFQINKLMKRISI